MHKRLCAAAYQNGINNSDYFMRSEIKNLQTNNSLTQFHQQTSQMSRRSARPQFCDWVSTGHRKPGKHRKFLPGWTHSPTDIMPKLLLSVNRTSTWSPSSFDNKFNITASAAEHQPEGTVFFRHRTIVFFLLADWAINSHPTPKRDIKLNTLSQWPMGRAVGEFEPIIYYETNKNFGRIPYNKLDCIS